MQVNNENRPFVNIVAGHLYDFQSVNVQPKNDKPDAVKALLLKFIEGQKGASPRAEAQEIRSFIDEATDTFKELLNNAFPDDCQEKTSLTTFWDKVVKEHTEAQEPAGKLAAERVLGQFIYLVDSDAKNTALLVLAETAQYLVGESFKMEMNKAKDALTARIAAVHKHNIVTEANDLRRSLLPTALAKVLITSNGQLNTAVFDDVKNAFFLKGDVSYQKEISVVLDTLAKRETCYQILEDTTAPESQDVASWSLILAMLDLTDDSEVSYTEAKMCALSAALSQVVHTAVDNDTSVIFGQLLKQANLARYMSDMNTLLETGCLEREVDGQNRNLILSITGNSSPLQKIISTSVNGSITDHYVAKNDRIWQVEGIIDACLAMGIHNVEEACKSALKTLGGEKPARRFSITSEQLILKMAQDDKKLAQMGNLAFTAAYENLLVRAWQNTLNSMATVRPRAQYVARMYQAVREVLFSHFTAKDIHERAALESIFSHFVTGLQSNLTTERITSPKALQELVIKALPQAELDRPQVKTVVDLVKTNTFIQNVSQKYDAVKKPWDVKLDVDLLGLAKTYGGQATLRFEPKSALGLFANIVEQAPSIQKDASAFLASPQGVLKITTPVHEAFSKAQARAFWDTIQDKTNAIMTTMTREEETRQQVYTWIQENILHADHAEEFAKDVTNIRAKLTFDEFRDEVHAGIENFIQGDGLALAKRELDNFFATLLTKKDGTLVIPFATSTKDLDGQSCTFCLYPDPVSKRIALGMIRGDSLLRLNQSEWFEGSWEFGQVEPVLA